MRPELGLEASGANDASLRAMPNRVLVVCYSRGGATWRVAQHLAEALDGELERIEERCSRAGIGGYVRSMLEALAKGVPAIGTWRDPRDYDLVVLGSPVWAGTMSSPVRSYVLTHPGQLRSAAFFAVMGGRGGEDTVREMQLACNAPRAPTCVLTEGDVDRGRYRGKCARFVQVLRERSREDSFAQGALT
jgi:menaquinone-dependent protoporphyrinogen IX oxidase